MKKTTIIFLIAAMAFLSAGFATSLFADDAATIDLLTSGPWKITRDSGGWSTIRVFDRNGTFSTPVMESEHGHWKIVNNMIVLVFGDGHKDTINLPLDPKGTPGANAHGQATTAVLQNAAIAQQAAPTPAPAPDAGVLGNNSADDLHAAIVKYAYTWDHDTVHYTIEFNADGTGTAMPRNSPKSGFKWREVSAQEIEIIRPDNSGGTASGNARLIFSQDFSSYTGTSFGGSPPVGTPVSGHQVVTKSAGAKPESPKSPDGGGGSGVFGSTSQTPVANAQAQAPQPASAVAPEMQQKASDLVKSYHNDLVFVTGKEGSGSGFIATIGKTNFLITNAHVAAGINDAAFKTLDDTTVQTGAASVAVGRDVFCMAVAAGGTPLEIMQGVDDNAAIGDDVVVLGNAEGEGVINTITGKIVGIGPDRVEIDAPFVPGNSGSPIIHLKTGKVIGMATYLIINNYDAATDQKNTKPVIRRFGYRLDNVKGWQAVDWRAFHAQAAEMQSIETLTADLGDFFDDIVENKGSVTEGRHTNPVIKNRIDQWLADKAGNHSAADENMANANFLSFLKVACQSDVTAAKQHMTYDYFQRELADQQQIRDEMSKAFAGIIKDISD